MGKVRSLAQRPGRSHEEAGLYVRVSFDKTAHGKAEDIVSPETQEDRARQYASSQGWNVAVVEQDLDESAFRQHYTKRAGLMRLLKAVEKGQIQKIVVYKFNRLSRRLRDFIEICDRVESAGGGIVSVSEQVDTSTPAGRLIRNIMASFAQFQSEEISEHVFESWMTRAKQGLRPPGIAPFGAMNKKGILVANPTTHQHLVRMYEVMQETKNMHAVWDYLVDNQVATPRKGKDWNLITIKHILTNPAYVAELHWVGERHEGKWDPLVPPALWESVQTILRGRSQAARPRRDIRMLTGMVICGGCGRPMWTQYLTRRIGGERNLCRIYHCMDPYTKRNGCKESPSVNAEELENAVWMAAGAIGAQANVSELSAGQLAVRTPDAATRAARRQQLLAESDGVRQAINELFDLLSARSITADQLREQNLRYLDRLKEIQASLDALPEEGGIAAIPAKAADAVKRIPTAVREEDRRQVLLDLGARIEVTPKQVNLLLFGWRINLMARRIGEVFYLGPEYQKLDYQGALLTDKQLTFIRRTYHWAEKQKIAQRIGRSYKALVSSASRMGLTASTSSATQ